MPNRMFVICVPLIAAGIASAQIVVDGTADAGYGPALSIQNTDTQFGNSTNPDPRLSNGSELDQVFGKVSNGYLYLMFAGNLESNFNKLEIFIDSVPGGVNTIVGAGLPAGVDAFCCGGFGTTDGALQRLGGLSFDDGFSADYYVTVTNGTESTGAAPVVNGWIATAHYADLTQGTAGIVVSAGGVLDPFGDELNHLSNSRGLPRGTIIDQHNNLFDGLGTDIALHEYFEPWNPLTDPTNARNHRDTENIFGMLMAVNQSNIAGVSDSVGQDWVTTGDPQNVTTGIEIALPLVAVGNPTGDIKVTAFISGGDHNYISNQFAGDGILSPNIGAVDTFRPPNLAFDYAGDQFVTIAMPLQIDGDLNSDGFVGLDDLDIVLQNWNQASFPLGDRLQGDPSGDGFVGLADLDIVLNNWNAGTPPAFNSPIPEPGTLFVLTGMLFIPRRRR